MRRVHPQSVGNYSTRTKAIAAPTQRWAGPGTSDGDAPVLHTGPPRGTVAALPPTRTYAAPVRG